MMVPVAFVFFHYLKSALLTASERSLRGGFQRSAVSCDIIQKSVFKLN
jgi:hypothetical protein